MKMKNVKFPSPFVKGLATKLNVKNLSLAEMRKLDLVPAIEERAGVESNFRNTQYELLTGKKVKLANNASLVQVIKDFFAKNLIKGEAKAAPVVKASTKKTTVTKKDTVKKEPKEPEVTVKYEKLSFKEAAAKLKDYNLKVTNRDTVVLKAPFKEGEKVKFPLNGKTVIGNFIYLKSGLRNAKRPYAVIKKDGVHYERSIRKVEKATAA